jgi:hypothetical protein
LRLPLLLPLSVNVSVDFGAAVVADNGVVAIALTLYGRGCSMYDAAFLLLKRGQHLPMWVARNGDNHHISLLFLVSGCFVAPCHGFYGITSK